METDKSRPFVLYVAEIIYRKIYEIKIKNPNLTNIQAFEIFIASDDYNEISSGNFHDKWFKELENNDYIDCLLYTSPSPRDLWISRMPSSA